MLRSRGEEDSGGDEEEEEVKQLLGMRGILEEILCIGLFDIFILILLLLLFDITGNEKVGPPRLPATESAGPVARATT